MKTTRFIIRFILGLLATVAASFAIGRWTVLLGGQGDILFLACLGLLALIVGFPAQKFIVWGMLWAFDSATPPRISVPNLLLWSGSVVLAILGMYLTSVRLDFGGGEVALGVMLLICAFIAGFCSFSTYEWGKRKIKIFERMQTAS